MKFLVTLEVEVEEDNIFSLDENPEEDLKDYLNKYLEFDDIVINSLSTELLN